METFLLKIKKKTKKVVTREFETVFSSFHLDLKQDTFMSNVSH